MFFDTSEKGLKIFINNLLMDLKHKKYATVEEQISIYEDFFIDCPSFFVLIHLKIRTIFKQIVDLLNSKIEFIKYSSHSVDKCIINAINQLSLLTKISQNNSSKQFEIVTRLYLELAYYNSIISRIKNEGYNSLAFNCYALNIMKLFLQKVSYPIEIRTYYYFQKNMLLVSKHLIEDNNYETAKHYQFNCLQIAIQGLCLIFKNNNDFLYSPYFNKLIEGISITLLHKGICEEYLMNIKQALEAYKQSKYFSRFLNVEKEDMFLFDLCDKLYKIAFTLFDDKITKSEQNLKKKKNKPWNKLDKTFSRYHELSHDFNRLKRKKIMNDKILKKTNSKDYLLMFVNEHLKEYKRFSPETKINLSHFGLYYKLLSPNYKEFVDITSNFEYDHPNKQKENIEAIEKFINSKIDVKNQNDKGHTDKNDIKSNINTNTKINSNNNITNNYSKRNKNNRNIQSKYYNTTNSFFLTKTESKRSIHPNSTYKDHPVTQEEKYILSNGFKSKLNHIDSLCKRDMTFQKMMLKLKAMNSATPKDHVKEISKVKEEVYQTYNILKLKIPILKKKPKENIIKKVVRLANIEVFPNNIRQIGLNKINSNCNMTTNKILKQINLFNSESDNKAGLYSRKNYVKDNNTDEITKLNREIEDIDKNIKTTINRNRKQHILSFSH